MHAIVSVYAGIYPLFNERFVNSGYELSDNEEEND